MKAAEGLGGSPPVAALEAGKPGVWFAPQREAGFGKSHDCTVLCCEFLLW